MNKAIIFIISLIIMIGTFLVKTTLGQGLCLPILCDLCDLTGICILNKPLEITSVLSLKGLTLNSILTLKSILTVQGDLLCNGTINLLNGVLNVEGVIKVTPLCILNITGPSTINATTGFIFPLLTVIFSPAGGTSLLNWIGDATISFTSITYSGLETPKFIFNGNANLTSASLTSPIQIGYAQINNARNILLDGIQIDQLFINQLQNTATLSIPINNLTLSSATATLQSIGTTLQSLSLQNGGQLLVNQALSIHNIAAPITNSTINILKPVSVLAGTIKSTVSVASAATLNLGAAVLQSNSFEVKAGGSLILTQTVIGQTNFSISGSLGLNSQTQLQNTNITAYANSIITINDNGIASANSNNNFQLLGGGILNIKNNNLLSSTFNIASSSALNLDVGKISQSSFTVAQSGSLKLTNGASIVSAPLLSLSGTITGLSGSFINQTSIAVQSAGSITLVGSASINKSPLISLLGSLVIDTGASITESTMNVGVGASAQLLGTSFISKTPISLLGSLVANTGSMLTESILNVTNGATSQFNAGSSFKLANLTIQNTGTFTLNGGAISQSPLVSVLGSFIAKTGSSISSSVVNVTSGASAQLTGCTVQSSPITVLGSLLVNTGSSITGSLLNITTGASAQLNGGTIDQSPLISVLGSLINNGASITNSALSIANGASAQLGGGSIVQTPISLLGSLTVGTGSTITNSLLNISTGAITQLTGGAINQSPLISLFGSLTVGVGSSITNSLLNISASATAQLTGGSITQTPIALLGSLTVGTGSTITNSLLNISTGAITQLTGGSISQSPLISLFGSLTVGVGSLISNSPLNVSLDATAQLNGGSITGSPLINLLGSISVATTSSIKDSLLQVTESGQLNILGSVLNTDLSVLGNVVVSAAGSISAPNLDIFSSGIVNLDATSAITNSVVNLLGQLNLNDSSKITQSLLHITAGALNLTDSASLLGCQSVDIKSNGILNLMNNALVSGSPLNVAVGGVVNMLSGAIKTSSIILSGTLNVTTGQLNQSPLNVLSGALANISVADIISSKLDIVGTLNIFQGIIKQSPLNVLTNGIANLQVGTLLNSPLSITGTVNSLLDTTFNVVESGLVPITINQGGLLSVVGEISIVNTLGNLVVGGDGNGLLSLAKNAVASIGNSVNSLSILDVQIDSLGGLLQSVGSLQIAEQIEPLDLLNIVSHALSFESGSIDFSNGLLSLVDKLSFVEKGNLNLVDSVVSLVNTIDELLVDSVNLVLDGVTIQKEGNNQFVPPRILVGSNASLNVSSILVDHSYSTGNGGDDDDDDVEDDSAFTIVYSPDAPIICNGQMVSNGTSQSSSYQFLCDNRLVILKFSNCSALQCPNSTLCVDSLDECPSAAGSCSTNPNYPYQCSNSICAKDLAHCPALPRCPINQQRCKDSSCSVACDPSLPDIGTFKYRGCPIGYYQCGDGLCSKDVRNCCTNTTCKIIPSYGQMIKSKSPFDTEKSVILPILSNNGSSKAIDIYGYINLNPKFINSTLKSNMRINALDDSYLDTINGTHIWGTDKSFRDSAISLIFNITIDNVINPIFDQDVQFQFKLNPKGLNMSAARLAFINTTTNRWELMNHVQQCDNNGSLCGSTRHFTSFGVLTNFYARDENSGSGDVNNLSRKTLTIILASVISGVVVVGVVSGILIAKIVKHGSLRYWWATKGGSSNTQVELE